MKSFLIAIAAILLLSFTANRYYNFRMTEAQAQYHWQNLEGIKTLMDQSNLPHAQVKQMIAAIDSLQKDMQRGLTIDSTVSKQK